MDRAMDMYIMFKSRRKYWPYFFFKCAYAREIWRLNEGTNNGGTPNSVSDLWNLGKTYFRHKTDRNRYHLSLIGATIWGICLERNNRLFNNKFASALSISYSTKHLASLWTGYEQSLLLYGQDMNNHNKSSPQQQQLLDGTLEGG